MSLCDQCSDPGACCRRFPLSKLFLDHVPIDQQWQQEKEFQEGRAEKQLFPFVPIEKDPRWHERKDGCSYWLFRCEALGADGRCGIYDRRPNGPCRIYQPAEDHMCAMYSTAEGILERYRQRKLETNQGR